MLSDEFKRQDLIEKVRRVATIDGVRHFKAPIGTPIAGLSQAGKRALNRIMAFEDDEKLLAADPATLSPSDRAFHRSIVASREAKALRQEREAREAKEEADRKKTPAGSWRGGAPVLGGPAQGSFDMAPLGLGLPAGTPYSVYARMAEKIEFGA